MFKLISSVAKYKYFIFLILRIKTTSVCLANRFGHSIFLYLAVLYKLCSIVHRSFILIYVRNDEIILIFLTNVQIVDINNQYWRMLVIYDIFNIIWLKPNFWLAFVKIQLETQFRTLKAKAKKSFFWRMTEIQGSTILYWGGWAGMLCRRAGRVSKIGKWHVPFEKFQPPSPLT